MATAPDDLVEFAYIAKMEAKLSQENNKSLMNKVAEIKSDLLATRNVIKASVGEERYNQIISEEALKQVPSPPKRLPAQAPSPHKPLPPRLTKKPPPT